MSEQLIELMLQLKKTTPAAAKQILNSQPQIAYALISLMVSMNAVNYQVFQRTLADFAISQPAPSAHPPPQAQSYPPPPPAAQSAPQSYPYAQQPPPPPPPPAAPTINPAILAAIPDDQKAMVMQVLSMTPEQLATLPPHDRANIMQLKATFGL
ncbi:hypothetical protein GYMLUDRAFT_34821 [Collybiopsis luxurians FD-317 M1]|nr:hypothetical protein GYMLUDRAFT_34821 [Collybiopsis luxurians FD-317 M1]